jgi:hypothetical protein
MRIENCRRERLQGSKGTLKKVLGRATIPSAGKM